MDRLTFNITKEQAKSARISIEIDGDPIFSIEFEEDEGGSLSYCCFDHADLDGDLAIEGHLPEYFDEETTNA